MALGICGIAVGAAVLASSMAGEAEVDTREGLSSVGLAAYSVAAMAIGLGRVSEKITYDMCLRAVRPQQKLSISTTRRAQVASESYIAKYGRERNIRRLYIVPNTVVGEAMRDPRLQS